MLNVKVKAKNVRLSIPVPYVILNLGASILSSKMLNLLVTKWTKKYMEEKKIPFNIPQIDKKSLKLIVHELKNHKGIVLVTVKAKDGTEVMIRL